MRTTILKFLALGLIGCGPLVTEPMPDIPQTVKYETVRIEYGNDDLLPDSESRQQELVGDISNVALITQALVRGTNRVVRAQLFLVDAISRFRPSEFTQNSWTWESQEERYSRLDLTRTSPEDESVEYELLVGPTRDEARVVLSGEFTNFDPEGPLQSGEGLLRFNFDNDPDSVSTGSISIAFRAANGVRQVRVAFFEFQETPDTPAQSALYEYTQFEDGRGNFDYAARQDFLKDGDPLELVSMSTAWTSEQSGRAAARIEGGSLQVNEVLLDECWDDASRVLWADATPNLPNYDDGEEDACDAALQGVSLSPPEVVVPTSDPSIPTPHPQE